MDMLPNVLIWFAIILILILLITGLIKKTLWMCVIAVIIAAICFVVQPERLDGFKNWTTNVINEFVEPFKRDDYSDLIDDGDVSSDKYNDTFVK